MLARVVHGVLVPLGTALDEKLDQRDVVAVDPASHRVEVPVAPLLVLVREGVGIGAGIEQHTGALADVGSCALRAAEQVEERDETVDRPVHGRGVGRQHVRQTHGIRECKMPLDPLETECPHVPDEPRPAGEAVVERELVLRGDQRDPALPPPRLRLLAQVLEVGTVGKPHNEPPVCPGQSRAEGSSS